MTVAICVKFPIQCCHLSDCLVAYVRYNEALPHCVVICRYTHHMMANTKWRSMDSSPIFITGKQWKRYTVFHDASPQMHDPKKALLPESLPFQVDNGEISKACSRVIPDGHFNVPKRLMPTVLPHMHERHLGIVNTNVVWWAHVQFMWCSSNPLRTGLPR